MKAYSIGRDVACDIVLPDNSDVISRRHALINVSSSGKITITDNSLNGTYVNGIKISPSVPVPVSRKDIISFAHVSQLDWNRVPSNIPWIRYCIMAFGAVVVIGLGIIGYNYWATKNTIPAKPVPAATDSIKVQKNKKQADTSTVSKGEKVQKNVRQKVNKPKDQSKKEKTDKENKDAPKENKDEKNQETNKYPVG